ncbi:DUF3040 domain-containing protein [Aestuariimicrobium ganziense]|uniref:DUF3040 domain-containing protein n=1 Tax=Aestuariimicrobium ganziense TaxID=2773677 RepID=UPI0019457FAC|nr:DUF3040 domain-containing protein [Aestuariimicrobium ganziense]
MALSDEEQRLLQQLEASLAKDDPKLAHTLRGTRPRTMVSARTTALSAVGFVLGLGLLVAGISIHWSVSVVGFLIMLASALVGLGAWKAGDPDPDSPPPTVPTSSAPTGSSSPFMDKLEERWRRRQDEGY